MKIIDILNLKANGELEDGLKFNHRTRTFTYYKDADLIQDEHGWAIGQVNRLEQRLNDTVEVIEEQKEIEKIKFKEGTYTGDKINIMANKLNELVREVNRIKKKER